MRSFGSWFGSLRFRSLWSQCGLRRSAIALLILPGLLTVPPLLHGQIPDDDLSRITRPWITVTVPTTDPGDTRSEVLAGVIADNLDLTLRLIGEYVVRPRPTVRTTPTDAAEAAAFAEAEGLDYLVFGRVSELPEGATLFSLSVYSREDGMVTLEREAVAATVFDTFDVADELAVDILGAFTGQRIAYGRIDLANLAEEPGEYLVYLDGEPAGTNVRVLERVLVGERLVEVVALEGPGAGRTMASQRVLVDEGSRAAVSFFFARPVVPEVAEVEREPDHGDEMMARALARLETERQALSAATPDTFLPMSTRVSVPVAEELFLLAGEYPYPDVIRTAALENARIAADLQILIGRRLLAGREYDQGAIAHQHVTELSGVFGREDLFGYRDAVSAVNWNWSELTVQRELKPMPWLPVVVTAWAVFSWQYTFKPGVYEAGGVVSQSFPKVPLLIGTGLVSVWNSNDWSIPQHRRLLQRSNASLTNTSRTASRTVWQPAPWELSAGIMWGFEGASHRVFGIAIPEEIEGRRHNGISNDGGDESLEYAVGTADLGISIALRRWINRRNALALEFIFGSSFQEAEFFFEKGEVQGYDGREYLNFGVPFKAVVGWNHTRSGRALLEAGLSYYPILFHEPGFTDSVAPDVERSFYRELFGEDDFTLHVFGAVLGVGWRFGALPVRPWGFSLRYHLGRFDFPSGVLGDEGVHWSHGFSFNLYRSFGLVGNYAFDDGDYELHDRSDPYTDMTSARSAVKEEWQPRRLAVFVDTAGTLGWGPRFGLEFRLNDQWSLTAAARQHVNPSGSSFARSTVISEELPVPDGYIFPGIGVRRYSSDGNSGWYIGGLTEVVRFRSLRITDGAGNSNFPPYRRENFNGDTIELEGWVIIPQLEGGYRIPIWRSLSLDVGVQAGIATGSGIESLRARAGDDQAVERPDHNEFPWYHLVVSVSTPVF